MGAAASTLASTPAAAAAAAHAPITTPAGLPLPPTLHATLETDKRVIIVGDIHGCAAELQALLAAVGFDREKDVLVSVGDAVNKGPDSLGAVRLLKSVGAVMVRGNHDEAALAVAAAARRGAGGSASTSPSPHAWAAGPGAADAVAYLAASPFSLYLPSHGVLVVHAGLIPGIALHDQALEDLVELRHVEETPTGWAAVPKKAAQKGAGTPWARAYSGTIPGLGSDIHVVFGHHASRRLQVEAHATGIDTACVNGDCLTALILPVGGAGGGGKKRVQGTNQKKAKLGFERVGGELVSVPAGGKYSADPAE